MIITPNNLKKNVTKIISETKIVDFHTHLFTPCHKEISWWGIDHLLTYHYIVAEAFRYISLSYNEFWALSQSKQADLIWKTLFVERTPISESCRGVITSLTRLGVNPNVKTLDSIREFYSQFTVETFIDKIFELSNIEHIYMTNDPLDPDERIIWQNGHIDDSRFKKALRVDNFFRNWNYSIETLNNDGFAVEKTLNKESIKNVRKFFELWCDKINPEYIGASLPPDFTYPDKNNGYTKLIEHVVIPIAEERNLPVALMVGVRRNVNPNLKSAGDGIGKGDVKAIENLCRDFPNVNFAATMLARENQHEMCIASRKFKNLLLFGCWWFMNNPSIIKEITRERLELLGLSMVPQHSDCRIIDQLLYKWDHSKKVIGEVLIEKYLDLIESGLELDSTMVKRDVYALLNGNVKEFLAK